MVKGSNEVAKRMEENIGHGAKSDKHAGKLLHFAHL